MERQIALNMQQSVINRLSQNIHKMKETMNIPIRKLSNYYSMVLERDVNNRQTWALLEAQAALFLGILPMGYAITVRLLALGWLLVALRKCRQLL